MPKRYDRMDVNNRLIWNFRDIGHTMRHISEGKGSQKRILIVLLETGPITQRELTQRLGIQPGSASEVIGKLEAAGLVTRTPNESDHRTVTVALSETGTAMASEVKEQREMRHQAMFSCLTEEEKSTLLSLLERINRHWDMYRGEPEV